MNSNRINVIKLLNKWLSRQVDTKALTWLEEKRQQIAQGSSAKVFFLAFSAVPRHTGKEDLKLTLDDWQTIEVMRSGWCPYNWSIDQAARTLLALSVPEDNAQEYVQTLEKVFTAADVSELVALYQALPLLPYPEQYRLRAAEGIRSNMTAVFNAVALCNPYPAEYFDDIAWNQMVLKALFIGSPLNLIQGLEKRSNPQLSQMLIDYAKERWAANRSVPSEIWAVIKPYGNASIIAELERMLAYSDSQ
ncbi:EboA family metabolite traffic protein [Gloeothece verrucosa]|nr:EboA family metabolite traffic protein [Gloeothece verrucosa]